jgi:hypothetical protein
LTAWVGSAAFHWSEVKAFSALASCRVESSDMVVCMR